MVKIDLLTQIIGAIESNFGLTFCSMVQPGHSQACVVKFSRLSDGQTIIAKFVTESKDESLLLENHHGYEQMITIGARDLVPDEYSLQNVAGYKVLMMQYIEPNFYDYLSDNGGKSFIDLRNFFDCLIKQTVIIDNRGLVSQSVHDTLQYIRTYSRLARELFPNQFHEILESLQINLVSGKAALFLLDFTPDNCFITDKLSFIDPWEQSTYLGHSAISIGQFVTLSRDIYQLKGSSYGGDVLLGYVKNDLARLLQSDQQSTCIALLLGSLLQFVLSAYVRKDSDLCLAQKFAGQAHRIVQQISLGGKQDEKANID